MTTTMIADDDYPQRQWFDAMTPVPGRHRRSDLAIEPVPVAEPVEWPTAEPAADELVDQADEPDEAPVDVEPVELDPLVDKRPGDTFATVPAEDPVCGALNEQAFAGDQTYACGRRPHPEHWQHIGVWQGRVQQTWRSPLLVDRIEQLLTEHPPAERVDIVEMDEIDEPFDERMEHVARTIAAAARVRTGLLDGPRRRAIAAVLVAYGNVTDTATSLPTALLVALERAVAVLGEPVAPVDQVAGVLDAAQSAGA